MQIPLEARNVTVKAGFKALLSSVSFRAHPGEVLAILGPSGAGKSTLFKTLNGSGAPDGGQVLYGADDLYSSFERYRRQIGYVPQDDILHDALTPFDVLEYTGRLRMAEGMEAEAVRSRVAQVLGQVELSERQHVKVRRLSGGQRKRVNLGVELMTSPSVLFLDEPTSGLDPALEEKMMELFRRLAREGRTVLVTTHVTENLDLVDRVLLLCDGRVTFVGQPRQALRFFGVEQFSDIYSKLTGKGAEYWARQYQTSPPPDLAPAVRPAAPAARAAASSMSGKTADELLAELEREMAREGKK
ncbi:MAG: ABC transporter ATP-binding protein [Candidatus Wallbacteria bacterium]|nr:ABC transporter ATP-binding protein [Candidatus Wallbacteria bacterium]